MKLDIEHTEKQADRVTENFKQTQAAGTFRETMICGQMRSEVGLV